MSLPRRLFTATLAAMALGVASLAQASATAPDQLIRQASVEVLDAGEDVPGVANAQVAHVERAEGLPIAG